jgi:predicted nucleic acid-binding protein
MIVVADTLPLNYLVLLGYIEILPKIYGEVLIPQAVLDGLQGSLRSASEITSIEERCPISLS